jgi:hypothetical protein
LAIAVGARGNVGIGIVLLFWLFVGTIAAMVGATVLRRITATLTGGMEGHERLIRMATWLPIACLGWGMAVFVFQAVIDDQVFHTDPGIGDSWYVPLPNGYMLDMIDVTDKGMVYNPKSLPPDVIVGQDDNVGDVVDLQVSGPYLLGSLAAGNDYNDARAFLIDTRTGKRQLFANNDQLFAFVKPLGIKPDFSAISDVYFRYRWNWFTGLTLLLFAAFPVAALVTLASHIVRLRKAKIVVSA